LGKKDLAHRTKGYRGEGGGSIHKKNQNMRKGKGNKGPKRNGGAERESIRPCTFPQKGKHSASPKNRSRRTKKGTFPYISPLLTK